MNDHASFSRITAIVAAPLALGASFTLGSAIEFDPDIMSNPAGLIAWVSRWPEPSVGSSSPACSVNICFWHR